MILGQATIATLETPNLGDVQEPAPLTNKHETHPLNRLAGLRIIYLALQTLIGPERRVM